MTQKSLGHVLYEAENQLARAMPFAAILVPDQEMYERMASAVAEVVREQCAKEAKTHHEKMSKIVETRLVCPHEWDASEAIRSMKT